MFVVRTALRDLIKLRRSGMGSVGAHMPLLRSLADGVACVTINRPLLTELSAPPPIPCEAGDACKEQCPPPLSSHSCPAALTGTGRSASSPARTWGKGPWPV
jgi:hypothetical protein